VGKAAEGRGGQELQKKGESSFHPEILRWYGEKILKTRDGAKQKRPPDSAGGLRV